MVENEIISYLEMCRREGMSLQRGMNFRLKDGYSVILMSVQPNAPYKDRYEDSGAVLIYEGHDVPRSNSETDPKRCDQPYYTASGRLTENGKFYEAAKASMQGVGEDHFVRVYEKLRQGIWSYNGVFRLEDADIEHDGHRNVFKFRLKAIEEPDRGFTKKESLKGRQRIIPTAVKLEVWKRDKGKCVMCGSDDELHFDHIIPYSKGGTSVSAANVQLLCARHNIQKSSKIE
ncbi:MAG: HNH endonuclease [Candidatus Hydrogenedentes bacterium]|nr:HNH endonuclease [Candidatus Hydrogenedentota bacterium]